MRIPGLRFPPLFVCSLLIGAATLSGCLTDTITGPQVVARLIYPPAQARLQAISYDQASGTGNMLVKWTRSPSDTQLNFKGYYIHLWRSTNKYDSTLQLFVGKLERLVDSGHVYRTIGRVDTSILFRNDSAGGYTVVIWSQKSTDTVGYSHDSLMYSGTFDPRPLANPTNLQATAIDPQTVKLHWKLPVTDTNQGTAGYAVYYVDTNVIGSNKPDSAHRAAFVPPNSTIATISGLPAPPAIQGAVNFAEHTYRFWVKSERVDSAFFYGDSNSISWAGAERLPRAGADTGLNAGYTVIHHTILFGTNSQVQLDVFDDSSSTTGDAMIQVSFSGQDVVLTPLGQTAISSTVDQTLDLDSIYYSSPTPLNTFSSSPVTLSASSADTIGRVVYVQIHDSHLNAPEWARLFVRHQADGTFINPFIGGIDIKARLQPATSNDGSMHLPYY